MFLKLRRESFLFCWFFFFLPPETLLFLCGGVNDEGCLFLLLKKGQALLTWISGESQWQEASRAINPEGWGSVENGQPSQFSARLPFAFLFRFHPFVCMLVTVIQMTSSSSCNSLSHWVDVTRLWSSFFLPHVHAFVACSLSWPSQIETPTSRLTALFVEKIWKCRIKRHLLQRHSVKKCALALSYEALQSQESRMAATISGHNYQHWLIHFLIALFNLFTYGTAECQAGANESNLLQGCGTDTSQWLAICMMTAILCSYSSNLQLNNVVK